MYRLCNNFIHFIVQTFCYISIAFFTYCQLFTEFESLLELQIASNVDSFFIGDFNIHIEDLNDYNARLFLKLLNTFDLLQNITHPTHDSDHTIDLVITNASSKFIIRPFMLDTYVSDHKTICIDFDLSKPTVHKTTFSCRQFKKN